MTLTTDRGNRERQTELFAGSGVCRFCPPNRGCNRWMGGRKPRPDRHKNHRR